ncbi:MAG: anaerobic ribonucleoside-triphosphate reductase activating protein [Clostridiaceae bacterium]|nr:anaerobic ribonucleoside-triphosphate reductase activating protein [Clostridiaceae bacterium]
MMEIAGLVRTSTVDFPGMIAAVVFTPGCNLDCFYCHNRQLLSADVPLMDNEEVIAYLKKRRGLIDGVVVSGGEPLLQQDLAVFLRQLKAWDYQIKLDTNGTCPDRLNALLKENLIDYVAVDYKAPWHRYPEICHCAAKTAGQVHRTLDLLLQTDLSWEARTTVPAQLTEADLLDMASALPPLPAYYLQICRKPAVFKPEDRFRLDAAGYTTGALLRLAEVIRSRQPHVQVRA